MLEHWFWNGGGEPIQECQGDEANKAGFRQRESARKEGSGSGRQGHGPHEGERNFQKKCLVCNMDKLTLFSLSKT
jgi:hypothetical protein